MRMLPWFLVLASYSLGCSELTTREAATEIMLRVSSSDASLLASLTSLRVELSLHEGDQWRAPRQFEAAANELVWPVDIPITPRTGGDDFAEFEVVIEAWAGSSRLSQTRLITSFVPAQRRVLLASLFACAKQPPGFVCAPDGCHGPTCTTCDSDGLCVPTPIDEGDALLPFTPDVTSEPPTTTRDAALGQATDPARAAEPDGAAHDGGAFVDASDLVTLDARVAEDANLSPVRDAEAPLDANVTVEVDSSAAPPMMTPDPCGAGSTLQSCCDASCAGQHGVWACLAAQCSLTGCEPNFGDCNGSLRDGCEVDLTTRSDHCGTCDHACAGEQASWSCSQASCVVTGCTSGYLDCDGKPSTGCETPIVGNPAACGACGVACASGICDGQRCLVDAHYGDTGTVTGSAAFASQFATGMQIQITAGGLLTALAVSVGATPNVHGYLGLYTDVNTAPGALVAQTSLISTVQGLQEVPVTAHVTLAAGRYWIMGLWDQTVELSTTGNSTVRDSFEVPFAPLPSSLSGAPITQIGPSLSSYAVVAQ